MSDVKFNEIYVINNEFEKRKVNTSIIYINFLKGNWIRTDFIGEKIIESCHGTESLEEVLNYITREYGISLEVIKNNCTSFLKRVIDVGLIYPKDKLINMPKADEKDSSNKYPNSIWIHVTGRCNLCCDFCYSKSGHQNKETLNLGETLNFLAKIPEEHREEIVISGGEPFIYEDIVGLIKQLKCELKYNKVRIITNGTVGHEKYSEIKDYIESLQFSVDGPCKEIHDKSRGNGSFDKMIKGLEEAKRNKIKQIMISFTPTANNIDYLKDMPRFAYENRVSRLHVTRLMPVGRGLEIGQRLALTKKEFNDKLEPFYDEYLNILSIIKDTREIYEIGLSEEEKTKFLEVTIAGDISSKVKAGGQKKHCGVGKGIISINFNSSVYACPSLHHSEYKLGTIYDDLETILKRGREVNFNLSVDNPKSECYHCKYKFFCAGGCKAISYALNGVNKTNEECLVYMETIDKLMATIKVE